MLVNVHLPPLARRSHDSLMAFASKVPKGTLVDIRNMRFRPWPHNKQVYFEDLRRLPRHWARVSNLEYYPIDNRISEAKQPSRWEWPIRVVLGRYFINREQAKDRSLVPGVWDKIWAQIPVAGEENAVEPVKEPSKEAEKVVKPVKPERKAVVMSNRPAPSPSVAKSIPQRPQRRKPKR